MCDTSPWIAIPIIILMFANILTLIFTTEDGGAWKSIIEEREYSDLTLGSWLALIVFTPSALAYYFFKYVFQFIGATLNWKPIKEPRIR